VILKVGKRGVFKGQGEEKKKGGVNGQNNI